MQLHRDDVAQVTFHYADLCDAGIQHLLKELAQETFVRHAPMHCFVIPGSSRSANIARSLELNAFKVLDDDENSFESEYREYETHSTFYLVTSAQAAPIAVTRILEGRNKSVDDVHRMFSIERPALWSFAGGRCTEPSTWDVATVGVATGTRATSASSWGLAILFAHVLMDARRLGINFLTSVVNEHINRRCQEAGLHWQQMHPDIPRDFDYINCSNNNACYLTVERLDESIIGQVAALHATSEVPMYLTHRL